MFGKKHKASPRTFPTGVHAHVWGLIVLSTSKHSVSAFIRTSNVSLLSLAWNKEFSETIYLSETLKIHSPDISIDTKWGHKKALCLEHVISIPCRKGFIALWDIMHFTCGFYIRWIRTFIWATFMALCVQFILSVNYCCAPKWEQKALCFFILSFNFEREA